MLIALEQETFQIKQEALHRKSTNQNAKRVMKCGDVKTGLRVDSPYTTRSLDGAITHLEFAVAFDGNIAVFGRRYWLDRVRRIASTPRIVPAQARRLQNLLEQLKDG